ncbi:MAG TPA: hypothetical protein VFW33_07095 [Gemmataceae bacterium]|nr:hypothetical protein [Gemmataceae bacterium]
MRKFLTVVLVLAPALPLRAAPEAKAPAGPVVSILLRDRHGHVVPTHEGHTWSGGGQIDVQQPAPDTVLVLMTGGVVAPGHPCHPTSSTMAFDLEQCFDVVFEKPGVKGAKVVLEGRVVGLLRGGRVGAASESGGCATVTCGQAGLLTLCVPDHGVAGCDSLAINDRTGPAEVPVSPGSHTLHAHWNLAASQPRALIEKATSAEFAPEPALDPLWVGGPRDPFHGAAKKEFGLLFVLKVVAEAPAEGNGPANGQAHR